ncbi:MAG: hypothetical protein QUU85_10795, partial [Candidatus Eisenbacteria bacterium]|nr:hypothetical protein [Candidatus Eisenbacteria bacterium]
PLGFFFVFGVRAIDEAGAVEPVLDVDLNVFAFRIAGSAGCAPTVTMEEARLGRHVFPDDGDTWGRDWRSAGRALLVPVGVPLSFEWTVAGAECGTGIGPLNYGLDVRPYPYPDSTGWSGWGQWTGTREPIVFQEDQIGVHRFFLLARDAAGDPVSERYCAVRLEVVPTPFQKFALVVDDARFQNVRDAGHDAFLEDALLARLRDFSDLGEVDHYSLYYGPGESGDPGVIPLEVLAQYQNVIWSCETVTVENGLWGGWENESSLMAYLSAGGRMFLFGGRVTGMNRGDYRYPVDPPGPNDDNRDRFYYQFMYLRDRIVSGRCTEGPCGPCYSRISGVVAARSLDPSYPGLVLDSAKWDPWQVLEGEYVGGVSSWEGSVPVPGQPPTRFEGLDSLYAVQTWNRSLSESCQDPSPVDGAICALRYESTPADTLADRQHGRIIYFLFQPYWFQPDQVLSAGTSAINWLVTGRD